MIFAMLQMLVTVDQLWVKIKVNKSLNSQKIINQLKKERELKLLAVKYTSNIF